MMDLRAFVEFVRSQCSVPARPEPGRQPCRIHHFTVGTSRGKRCCSIGFRTNAARDASTSGRPTGGAISDERTV